MTRGRIIFIDHEGYFYVSIEFNGDMHPYNRGSIIIDNYKNGKIKTKSDFIDFVYKFNKEYYYDMEREELINFGKASDNKISLSGYFPDHFYIINHSGTRVEFASGYGSFEIENNTMTITDYKKIDQVVTIDNPSNKGLILGEFLNMTSTDDYYWINVRDKNQQIYYGYVQKIPDEIKSHIIQGIFIDWASECLGITVLT